MLENLGWAIHRIWSTEWMHHPNTELQRVIVRINELLESGDDNSRGHTTHIPEPTVLHGEDIVLEHIPESGAVETVAGLASGDHLVNDRPIAIPYRAAELRSSNVELWETPLGALAQTIIQCVEEEGPIHKDLLVRRVSESWGYQRAGSRIGRHIEEATAIGVHQGRIRRNGAFLWPSRVIEVVPRGPATDGTLREISHIPDDEIAQTISAILGRALSLSPDDLVFQTSRVFGFRRAGQDIRERILSVARAMYGAKILDYKGDRVQLVRT